MVGLLQVVIRGLPTCLAVLFVSHSIVLLLCVSYCYPSSHILFNMSMFDNVFLQFLKCFNTAMSGKIIVKFILLPYWKLYHRNAEYSRFCLAYATYINMTTHLTEKRTIATAGYLRPLTTILLILPWLLLLSTISW